MFRKFSRRLAVVTVVWLTFLTQSVFGETKLVMVEEQGCVWCERWNSEIGPIYPKTTEGKIAPLRRIDLHEDLPDDLTIGAPLFYTPTFLLVKDGQEIDRIEGYPGEDFFWAMLAMMIEKSQSGE